MSSPRVASCFFPGLWGNLSTTAKGWLVWDFYHFYCPVIVVLSVCTAENLKCENVKIWCVLWPSCAGWWNRETAPQGSNNSSAIPSFSKSRLLQSEVKFYLRKQMKREDRPRLISLKVIFPDLQSWWNFWFTDLQWICRLWRNSQVRAASDVTPDDPSTILQIIILEMCTITRLSKRNSRHLFLHLHSLVTVLVH